MQMRQFQRTLAVPKYKFNEIIIISHLIHCLLGAIYHKDDGNSQEMKIYFKLIHLGAEQVLHISCCKQVNKTKY